MEPSYQQPRKVTPEKVITHLQKQGQPVKLPEAAIIADFLYLLAEIIIRDKKEE